MLVLASSYQSAEFLCKRFQKRKGHFFVMSLASGKEKSNLMSCTKMVITMHQTKSRKRRFGAHGSLFAGMVVESKFLNWPRLNILEYQAIQTIINEKFLDVFTLQRLEKQFKSCFLSVRGRLFLRRFRAADERAVQMFPNSMCRVGEKSLRWAGNTLLDMCSSLRLRSLHCSDCIRNQNHSYFWSARPFCLQFRGLITRFLAVACWLNCWDAYDTFSQASWSKSHSRCSCRKSSSDCSTQNEKQ